MTKRARNNTARRLLTLGQIMSMLACCLLVTIAPIADAEITQQGLPDFIKHPLYNPSACGATNDGTINLTGDADQKVMTFMFLRLSGAGAPAQNAAYGAAGVVGNFLQETSTINPFADDGRAHGIGQWEGGRWQELQDFVAAKNEETGQNKPWTDFGYQLEFLWSELPNQHAYAAPDPISGVSHLAELQKIMPTATEKTSALDALKASTSPEFAAIAFDHTFERPSKPMIENRIAYANAAYAKYGDKLAASVDSAITAASGACGAGNVNTEGYSFPLAPQTQRDYIGLPCAGPNEIPGYGARGSVGTYDPTHGPSATIRTCHHEPLSPAFDLYYGPNEVVWGGSRAIPVGSAGKPIYAITNGSIDSINWQYCNPKDNGGCASSSGKYCTSINFQSSLDHFYYWYGHVLADESFRDASKGKELKAGQQIGIDATVDYGPKCWGGAPHLHIDRGCHEGDNYYLGGGTFCRDPDFMPLMQKIWLGLPKE